MLCALCRVENRHEFDLTPIPGIIPRLEKPFEAEKAAFVLHIAVILDKLRIPCEANAHTQHVRRIAPNGRHTHRRIVIINISSVGCASICIHDLKCACVLVSCGPFSICMYIYKYTNVRRISMMSESCEMMLRVGHADWNYI